MIDRPWQVLARLREAVTAFEAGQLSPQAVANLSGGMPGSYLTGRWRAVLAAGKAYAAHFGAEVDAGATPEQIQQAEMVRCAIEMGGALRAAGYIAHEPGQRARMAALVKARWFAPRGERYELVNPYEARSAVGQRENPATWS